MNEGPRRSLAWRLVALGLAQLAVLLAVAAILAAVTRPTPPPRGMPERLMDAAIRDIAPVVARGKHRDVARALGRMHRRFGVDLSAYDGTGALLGTTVEPPIAPTGPNGSIVDAPPPGHPRRPPPRPYGPPPPFGGPPPPFTGPPPGPGLLDLGAGPPAVRIRLDHGDARGVLMVQFPRRLPPFVGPLLTLLSALLVIGAGAFLTARWITGPLDRLARTARLVGAGDLRARTGLARRDELGEVARAFDEMAGRVEGLLRAERELLANVSHELRTPLARIRVAMDLAAEGDAEAARAAVAEIGTDLAELEGIVDDILVAMRLDVDGPAGARADVLAGSLLEVPARAIAERAAERFRARHPARTLDLHLDDALPAILVDPVFFRRALDNLLENAHKYSPQAGTPVTLRAALRDGAVVFAVEDRGVGISADDLAHAFDPFFRAERSRSRGAGGVGLGLTLAKRIVEGHGGTIALASRPGEGTVATVVLPVRPRPQHS